MDFFFVMLLLTADRQQLHGAKSELRKCDQCQQIPVYRSFRTCGLDLLWSEFKRMFLAAHLHRHHRCVLHSIPCTATRKNTIRDVC